MPRTREATVEVEDLPAVMTTAELAAFERVDERTLRKELECGHVPGAYRRARAWRIVRDTYLASIAVDTSTEPGGHR